ncbi:MAG: DNA polymerase-4 [Saprospiraceae bacterium]
MTQLPRPRKIIHIDMDCFYAAVEMRDNPALRGIPIAVGGSAARRGVITTCNYEARAFGIHSAMATAYALRLCAQLVLVPVRMEYYKQVSTQIREIFNRYTDKIEPLSLDEAFLDVTDVDLFHGSATLIAEDIRRAIETELNLTASAGVAPNKFLAKICSDENKPNGQCVIVPAQMDDFVRALPLGKIPGVGKVSVKRLADLGLSLCDDVRQFGEAEMVRHFGGSGSTIYQRAMGIDDRPLVTNWVRKSLSVERTFAVDISSIDATHSILDTLYAELHGRLQAHQGRPIKNQQVKLKFADFRTTTVERSSQTLDPTLFKELLPMAWLRGEGQAIRLLGIGVSFQDLELTETSRQLRLFR